MEDFRLRLNCKTFDAWISFLRRLSTLGKSYVLKNDVMVPTMRGALTKDKSITIPGKHHIKDPFFDNNYNDPNVVYLFKPLGGLIEEFKEISKSKDLRKNIVYEKTSNHINVIFGDNVTATTTVVQVAYGTLSIDVPDNIKALIGSLNTFDGVADIMTDDAWHYLTEEELIHLRDGDLIWIKKRGEDIPVTRLAKSLFPGAGVTRVGNPLAISARWAVTPPNDEGLTMLIIHGLYKCGTSPIIQLECMHEYIMVDLSLIGNL